MALNSAEDALISASYTHSVRGERKSLIYLFRSATCSYDWYLQGDPVKMLYPRGVAWSAEETKAYVISTNLEIGLVDTLTIFEDPYLTRAPYNDPRPRIFEMTVVNI